FCRCESLTSVTIPESVMSIGDMAFSECPNLTIQYTGTRAQWEALRFETFGVPVVCTDDSLGSENQPAVLTIQNRVVVKCDPSAAGYIEIQPGVTEIAANAFDNCIYVKGVIIPEGVTKIGYGAFRFCSDMLSVQIPDSVTYIGDKAFEYCDRLETVNFTGSLSRLTTLGLDTKGFDAKTVSVTCYYGNYRKSGRCYYVESGDTALTGYVIIPSGVTEIAYRAFEGCKNIVGVGIPMDVTYIGDAFDGCTNLTFIAIANMQAKCYSSVKRSYIGTITEWIESDHEWSVSEINEKPITEITADDFAGITKIGSKAFTGFTELWHIDIPDHVTSIGDSAFYMCTGYVSVTIPDSVISIGNSAFYDCMNLKSVTIPDGVTSIGSDTFYWCRDLKSVTIPSSVTSIGSSAFYMCESLSSVTIPNSVTFIRSRAFGVCGNLTRIDFKGTQAQWESITKDTDWNYNTGDYIVYCTDGTISKQ
ncbi:MAG: leucine-rich repeat domain-containing protein, partial [Treponemataceae bacterium]|nr:leucine-rich repeat domain-containing protein [Treponemataceae bacterium]